MSNLKTSLLVNQQVPEFVSDEYPLFVSFMEAYYEYLETAQGTEKNNVLELSKDLRYISDVDLSIDAFETNFFNTFADLLPRDVEVNKETLIKNVLPIYLSKGNEKSFKLLFRMLFNDNADIILPQNNILRLSDGNWVIDNVLKLETDIRTTYTANGNTSSSAVQSGNTLFYLSQQVDTDELLVYVNDNLQIANTHYKIRKESRKLIFNSAPVANSTIKAVYTDFDITTLNNRKITGLISGATAIVERASKKIITDRLNLGLPYEIFINQNNLTGTFINGEKVISDIIDSNGTKILLEADTFSILTSILVTNGGASYNVGDTVTVLGGGATSIATAEVESVESGFTNRFTLNYGGAGFLTTSLIHSSNTPGTTIIVGAVNAVDSSGINAHSTFLITDDVISAYTSNIISDLNYGFPSTVIPTGENTSTRIVDALTPLTISNLGSITNTVILFSNTSVNTAILDSEGANYLIGNTFYDIKSYQSIARIDVNSGGSNYKIGDEIKFGANPSGTYGYGAAAAVTNVSGAGAITAIRVQSQRTNGTANVLNNSILVIGTNTQFGTDVKVGDKITIRSQDRYINVVSNSTHATVNSMFTFIDATTWSNNNPIGLQTLGPVGGVNYVQDSFPSLTVTSAAGTLANVQITSAIGNGEKINATAGAVPGQIIKIRVITGGTGYQYIPQISLQASGDGSATGNAIIGSSYSENPGRWTTSDSILSNSERRLQGSDYYVNFSYIISSFTQLSKYKKILKDLLHPAGFVSYSDFNKYSTISSNVISVSSSTANALSGTVNTGNASIYITGTNTKIALTRGTITVGSNVAINGQSRIVTGIISNTNISVSSAFTMTANDKTLIIIT